MNPDSQGVTKDQAVPARIWEIDFLRGLSIILMVFYHLFYDLGEMGGVKRILGVGIDLSDAPWLAAQNIFAGLFIILSGISSTLSRSNVRRALKILGVAVVITAVTYVYDSSSAILFGILHCLAVCILIYGLAFPKAKFWTCAWAAAIVFGLTASRVLLLKNVPIHTNWFLPLGITGDKFASLDFFPLLPWFGVFLAGTALGKSAYSRKRSLIPRPWPETFINAAGRHSLLIYVVHQPVILAVLYLLGLLR